MSCMSPYSIPLWTILTYCDARQAGYLQTRQPAHVSSAVLATVRPSAPVQRVITEVATHTQSQQGSPSVWAAVFWKISLMAGHAASLPPGTVFEITTASAQNM